MSPLPPVSHCSAGAGAKTFIDTEKSRQLRRSRMLPAALKKKKESNDGWLPSCVIWGPSDI